jgi:hypothetical protein
MAAGSGFQRARLDAIVAGGPGLIAGGSIVTAGRRLDGAIWTSSDGRAWRRASGAGGFEDAGVGDIAANGRSFLALGATCALESECAGTRIWTSMNGSAWTAARPNLPQDASMSHAVAGPAGWLGAGSVGDLLDSRPAVWSSADGVRWTEARGFEGARGYVLGLAATNAAFVAYGSVGPPDALAAAVWVSDDGSAWERVPAGRAPAGAEVTVAGSVGDVIVAFSRSLPTGGVSRVWTSRDGRSWQESRVGTAFRVSGVSEVYVTTLVQAANGLIAFGDADLEGGTRTVGVWVTTDGESWQAGDATALARARVRDGVVLGGSAFAVGEALCAAQCPAQGIVWGSPPR